MGTPVVESQGTARKSKAATSVNGSTIAKTTSILATSPSPAPAPPAPAPSVSTHKEKKRFVDDSVDESKQGQRNAKKLRKSVLN